MAINATLLTVIKAICQAIVAVFSYFLAVHNTKNDKKIKIEQKTSNAKDKIDDACDEGTLGDLLDATKELGDSKK